MPMPLQNNGFPVGVQFPNLNDARIISCGYMLAVTAECDALGFLPGNLQLVASSGLSDKFLNKGPVSAEKSVTQAMRGETVIIDDVENDDRLQYRDEVLQEGIASMLVVPIKVKEDVIGILRLCSAVKRHYPRDIIVLVEALAQTGGLAIQNASLYMALQDDMKELKDDIWSHRTWF